MGVTTDLIDITKISKTANGHDGYAETVVDVEDFFDRVLGEYNEGTAEEGLAADDNVARSIIPAGTGVTRDFSYIAPEIPAFHHENCVGCMTCVNQCPDTAILGKVIKLDALEASLAGIDDDAERGFMGAQFAETSKFYKVPEKRGQDPGKFGIFIDPTKCKGCAECVEACADLGYNALSMIHKEDHTVPAYQKSIEFFRSLPPTPAEFINDRVAVDMMLAEESMLYVGGAGSCAGCGEATVIRMWLAALGYKYGAENIGIAASTGCNTVYGSTYPYNPYIIPWSNSLFENGPAFAMGIRMKWDQQGWQDKQLWVMGGDGAMLDIGFQSLSRMLASGMNIKVLVLDTQVYSNTGGQTSTASYMSQESKMYAFGSAHRGKEEQRKELGRIAMMHPNTYVAQTVASIPNHFYKSVLDAASFDGPAIVNCYTTCQPEHGVADDMARHQAKLAVESRAFPVFTYDPRSGDTIRERLSLTGNPAQKDDWYTIPKTGETIDFITFARSEGRFAKQFDKEGNPSDALMAAQADRLANWHLLQEMAGIR
ncbi:MAG: thiamine pyrophosphate-binding protein [Caldilineaceae bacterium]|nr:thiamine pyrophosphate-binding protein [Caldilineaceae bacterium]